MQATKAIVRLDLGARIGMGAGVSAMLQPWFAEGLRYGFFIAAIFTILHIYTSHKMAHRRDGQKP